MRVVLMMILGLVHFNVMAVEVGYSLSRPAETGPLSGKLQQVQASLILNPAKDGKLTRIVLEKGKVYNSQILIKYSNVILDCNHAILDGQGRLDSAIVINGRLNEKYARPLKNILIKNCQIMNYLGAGIAIYNDLRPGGQANPYLNEKGAVSNWFEINSQNKERSDARDIAREKSSKNVIITNVKIEQTNHGIYIGPYVKGTVVSDSSISKNTIGMHISYSSHGTKVLRSFFNENGLRGEPGSDREAIVMDGSSKNVIAQNIFANNHGSSIRTYKNCGELAMGSKGIKDRDGKTREEGANNNAIVNNLFYLTNSFYKNFKDKKYQAISIAARQSRNSLGWMCSDGFYYVDYNKNKKIFGDKNTRMIIKDKDGKFSRMNLKEVIGLDGIKYNPSDVRAIARDYSRGNRIENNHFRNYGNNAIHIQDDGNTVANNTFIKGTTTDLILVGSKFREKINDPVRDNRISGNCIEDVAMQATLKYASSLKNNQQSSGKCGYIDQNLEISK